MADVLVVDDDATIRGLLVRILQRDGYAVDEAEDGVQAMQRLRVWGNRRCGRHG